MAPGRVAKRQSAEARAALSELASITEQVRMLEDTKSSLAQRAVARGATWEAVGEALKLPRATAYKRYGPGSFPSDRV